MIEIVLLACLITEPARCREHVLPSFVDVTAMQCIMGAPVVLAQWSGHHPGQRIVQWSCREPLRSVSA